jgi:diguanylate cyclase (GGDEF)-like protein
VTGLLPGVALFILSYSFYMWLRYRKPHTLYFAGYAICLVLFSATQSTGGEQAIHSEMPWPGPRLPQLLSSLSAASGAGFCLAFLSLYRLTPAMARILKSLAAINGMLAVAAAITHSGAAAAISFFATTASALVCLSLSVLAGIRYRSQLLCFCAGWSIIALGLLAHALAYIDVWPQSAVGGHSLPVAISLGLLLLTLALCEQFYAKSRQELRQQLEATQAAELSRNELSLNCRQLRQQNQDFEQLLLKADRFDGVTGLLNITAFHLELEREYKTALRHGNIVTVLALEISDLDQVYEGSGRTAGDSYLNALAQTVSESLQRPGDITGRIAGNRLGIVLPYTNIDGSLAVVQRIKHCIYQWKRNNTPMSGPIKLRAGIASTENSLARHADDLIESAMAQIRELED